MANKSGKLATLFFDRFDPAKLMKDTGTTVPDTWYRIIKKGAASTLPLFENFFFKSPKDGTQFTLVTGDILQPVDMNRWCRTSASWQTQQGTIDASTDCNPGASILDGIKKTTGSIEGFVDYDEVTGEFTFVTDAVMKYFFDFVTDDGEGGYTHEESASDNLYLFCQWNTDAKEGQYENYFICPIILPSISGSLGIQEMQSMSISWEQGDGQPIQYKRLKAAA